MVFPAQGRKLFYYSTHKGGYVNKGESWGGGGEGGGDKGATTSREAGFKCVK